MPSARTVLLLVTASIAIAPVPAALADPPKADPDAVRIARLIEQLGSESFTEREAATKALREIGEPALEALERAEKNSPDAEVRRRVVILAKPLRDRREEQEVEIITKDDSLRPWDKGRKLTRYVRPGMSAERVTKLLGLSSAAFVPSLLSDELECYASYGLDVWVSRDGTVTRVVICRP